MTRWQFKKLDSLLSEIPLTEAEELKRAEAEKHKPLERGALVLVPIQQADKPKTPLFGKVISWKRTSLALSFNSSELKNSDLLKQLSALMSLYEQSLFNLELLPEQITYTLTKDFQISLKLTEIDNLLKEIT